MFQTVGVRAVVEGVGQYMADIDRMTTRTNSAFENVGKRVGQSMTQAGTALTAGITLPLVGVGFAATKLALDFEQTMTNIATQTNIPKESLDDLRNTIFKLSHETAKSPEELGAGAYFILSAGFSDAADAANILEIAAKQSAIGMGTVEVTARTTAGLLKAYGEESSQAAKFGDMMTATVKEGAAEASQMAAAFANVVPGAAALGIKFEVVGGAMAQMTNKFFSADEAGTALNQLFTQLISPSDDLKKNLESLGFTTEGLLSGLRTDAQGTLRALGEAVEAAGENTGATLFADNVRASRAFVSAFGKDADDTMAIIDRIGNSTGSQDESFKTLSETDAQKIKIAINDVRIAMTQLGIILLPIVAKMAVALMPLVKAFSKVVEIFGKLPAPLQLGILGFVALLAALGPILLIVGTLITSITAIAGAVAIVAPLFGGLVVVLLPLVPLILAIVAAAVVLAAVAYLIYKNWDTIRAFFEDLPGKIMGAVSGIKDFLVGHWKDIVTAVLAVVFPPGAGLCLLATNFDKVKKMLGKAMGGIKDLLVKNWKKALSAMLLVLFPIPFLVVKHFNRMKDGVTKAISDTAQTVVSTLKGMATDALRVVSNFVRDVIRFFTDLPGKLAGALSNLISTVVGAFLNLASQVLGVIGGLIQGIINFFVGLPGRIVGAMGNVAGALIGIGQQLVGGLLSGVTSGAEGVYQFFRDLPGKILNAIGDLAHVLFDKGKELIQGLVDGILSVDIPNPLDLIPDINPPGPLATGGPVKRTALYRVGEQGPETVILPGGAHVIPATASQRLKETATGRKDRASGPRIDQRIIASILGRIRAGTTNAVDALSLLRMGLTGPAMIVQKAIVGLMSFRRAYTAVQSASELRSAGSRQAEGSVNTVVSRAAAPQTSMASAVAPASPTMAINVPISVYAQQVDWLEIRNLIHAEVDRELAGNRHFSTRQGAVLNGGIG